MLAAHVLDNRTGVCGLKTQSYIHFGLPDYNSHIEKFLKSDGGGNTFNKIHQIPTVDLLTYGGMDAMLEFRLASIQTDLQSELERFHGSSRRS